jgi:hypothetical protein
MGERCSVGRASGCICRREPSPMYRHAAVNPSHGMRRLQSEEGGREANRCTGTRPVQHFLTAATCQWRRETGWWGTCKLICSSIKESDEALKPSHTEKRAVQIQLPISSSEKVKTRSPGYICVSKTLQLSSSKAGTVLQELCGGSWLQRVRPLRPAAREHWNFRRKQN